MKAGASGDAIARVAAGRSHEPHAWLGTHRAGAGWSYRALLPEASGAAVALDGKWMPLTRRPGTDLFEWEGLREPQRPARLRIEYGGTSHEVVDPYAFAPSITPFELYLFNSGRLFEAWRTLGALPMDARRRRRGPLRGLGAECRARLAWSATSTAGTAAGIR